MPPPGRGLDGSGIRKAAGGVTIGPGTVIGAGSVVTRDLPGGVFAAGNPCRVIRTLSEADSIHHKPELW